MTRTRTRAAIYARISRDIAGEGHGVERQLEDCRTHATQLGLTVVEEFTDNDTSAYKSRARPGYEGLMTAIENGRVDAVVCWHTDRLHRQTRELEAYIVACEPRSISTYTVTAGHLDLSTPSGRATAKTRGAWAQFESEHKADRIRRQKLQAARQGKFLGGRIPWGWKATGSGVEVDPEAAEFIREGTRSITDGVGLIEVTRRWAEGGARSLSGTRMNTTQVKRVLMRSRNAGIVTFHGEPVASEWPAIVTVDEFRRLEAVLTDPGRPAQSESKFKYLLSGTVRCWCGRAMTGFGVDPTPERPKYRRSYRCTVHSEGGRYVRGHAIRAMEPLDDYVLKVVAGLLGREDLRREVLDFHANTITAPEDRSTVPAADLLARRNDLVRLFNSGLITESQLVEGTADIRDRLASIENVARAKGRDQALVTALTAPDPGQHFLAQSKGLQRAIIRAVARIQLIEGAGGGAFSGEHVNITRAEG